MKKLAVKVSGIVDVCALKYKDIKKAPNWFSYYLIAYLVVLTNLMLLLELPDLFYEILLLNHTIKITLQMSVLQIFSVLFFNFF